MNKDRFEKAHMVGNTGFSPVPGKEPGKLDRKVQCTKCYSTFWLKLTEEHDDLQRKQTGLDPITGRVRNKYRCPHGCTVTNHTKDGDVGLQDAPLKYFGASDK